MPESEERKENSSEGQKPRTEFERFKALASSLLKVRPNPEKAVTVVLPDYLPEDENSARMRTCIEEATMQMLIEKGVPNIVVRVERSNGRWEYVVLSGPDDQVRRAKEILPQKTPPK